MYFGADNLYSVSTRLFLVICNVWLLIHYNKDNFFKGSLQTSFFQITRLHEQTKKNLKLTTSFCVHVYVYPCCFKACRNRKLSIVLMYTTTTVEKTVDLPGGVYFKIMHILEFIRLIKNFWVGIKNKKMKNFPFISIFIYCLSFAP